jgi:hypothetical protein
MKYKVRIKSKNKIFIINNKPVRSPFECFIHDTNISLIKSRIKFYGLQQDKDYTIELIDNISEDQKKDYSYIPPIETNREERITNENKGNLPSNINKNEIKQKDFKEEKLIHNPIKKPRSNKKLMDEKVLIDSNNNEEQIINENENDTSEIEVKIEELTVKSSSILEKFMNNEFN